MVKYLILFTLLFSSPAYAVCSSPQALFDDLFKQQYRIISIAKTGRGDIFIFIDINSNYKIVGIHEGTACELLAGNDWEFIQGVKI